MSDHPIGYIKRKRIGYAWSIPRRPLLVHQRGVDGWRLTLNGTKRAVRKAHERYWDSPSTIRVYEANSGEDS